MAIGKQLTPARAHPYSATHHPPILPPRLTRQQNGRGKLMALIQHDEVFRNSFVRFSSMPIAPDFFALILANTTN